MRSNGKRIVPLVAVMFVLTQCCCCIGIPIIRSNASAITSTSNTTSLAENAASASIYRLPAEMVDYVSQNVQTMVQNLR